ncbi:MDR family MFS transporter [Streptomyces sp. NPDC051133]|uniref:MDR family MFS transporter n=1 Tax=Streptomyces sp. NPDC051133 TaxID=3155521 RepID=UPI00342E279A
MDPLLPGDPTRVGPYRLIARLGEGGMGLVYLGRDEDGRTVAVKVVQADYAGHQEFRRRFAREVAAARRVGGSWTAAVLDADPEAGVPWVATQYIPGPDLHTVVAKDFGPLPEHSVRVLASRLAHALRAVHEAGLIHRDLKPSNVLVTVDGPRVIDFGIARAMDSLSANSLLTRTGMLIGSPGFMSPEQVRGLELTPASDVFCLGAVLVHATTGRLLFGAAETGLNAHLFRVAEEEPDLTGVPESLLDLVRACLHKDPARRPTPSQVVERTAPEPAGEWLPSAVLAQLGRHAAQLLDFAPVPRAEPPADAPAARPDPRVALARAETQGPPQPRAPEEPGTPAPPPSPPAYTPTTPASGPPSSSGPHPRRWWGLAALVLAQLTVLLQAGMGLWPAVGFSLRMSYYGPVSVLAVHGFFFGALLLSGGHLADLVGRRRTLVIGLAGVASASLLGALAANPAMMIAARALQGAFAALVTPAALALVSTTFTEPKERRKAFGIYASAAVGGVAFMMLPIGVMLQMRTVGWRPGMLAAAPLALIALVGARTALHDGPRRTGSRFDVPGALLAFVGVGALTFGLGQGREFDWAAPVTAVLLGGVAVLGVFLWWQARRSDSLLPSYIVRDRGRVGCYLAVILSGVSPLGLFGALTFHLLYVQDDDQISAGIGFFFLFVGLLLGATQVSARLLDRVGPRILITAGLVTAAAGLALLTVIAAAGLAFVGYTWAGMLVPGFGLGVALMPVYSIATDAVVPQDSGAASAALATSQHLGGALGATLVPASGTLWPVAGGFLLAALLAVPLLSARTRTTRTGPMTPA